jgi:cytochrome P450 / NADPH-cytochrome P450 reductase
MLCDKSEIYSLWYAGAKIYICGSREVFQELGKATKIIVKEGAAAHGKEVTPEDLDKWIEEKRNEQFVSDVFQ